MNLIGWISLVCLCSGSALLLIIQSRARFQANIQQRLDRVLGGNAIQMIAASNRRSGQSLTKTQHKSRFKAWQNLLQQAGFNHPRAVIGFLLAKALFAITFATFFFWFLSDKALAVKFSAALVGGLLGSVVLEILIESKAKADRAAMSAVVPDLCDLLVICIEAGYTIDRSLARLSGELAQLHPRLSKEMAQLYQELQVLSERQLAYSNLVQRTGVDAFETLVSTLVQTERFGTALAPVLRLQSADLRNLYLLTLEEKAGKIPAKMSIPLMVLILIPLVTLIASPFLVQLIRQLESGL